MNKAKLLQLPASFFLAGNMCGSTPPHPTPLPVPLLPPPLLAQLNRLAKDKAWLDANLPSIYYLITFGGIGTGINEILYLEKMVHFFPSSWRIEC